MAVENRERLNEILRELKDGMSSNPVSVREFISWFGAERRGYMVAYKIRKALESLGVKTEPDFDSVPLDFLLCIPLTFQGSLSNCMPCRLQPP